MYFRIIDHYNDDFNELIDESINCSNDECFICFQFRCDDGTPPIKLNYTNCYCKPCSCDGFIHKKCLDIWYNSSHKCPICRTLIERKPKMYTFIYNNCDYVFLIYIFIKNNVIIFSRYITIIFFIYYTIDIYLTIITNKTLKYNTIDYDNYYNIYYLNNSIC
jgi:hypothetical protein